ncbi:hypothetical protein PENARI_c030G07265 [Penicillium arizonense]|uniref:Uncharacterized protein n=1 Tax=Penicillium arizonense TaxID=1835702 RepID=A0A1F5L5T3_PENAI|nr:hypothetical protein PENARI_c030G07265 [Penicillium arizonense]OGE48289.1 hypothetical protein PENARI_c030G07265 [Penicillium arizonense]
MTTTPASDVTIANFGPLTTTFSPPSWCATANWVSYNTDNALLAWGAVCVTRGVPTGATSAKVWNWASTCYPEGIKGVFTGEGVNNVFTPGNACPSGWTANYTTSAGQRGLSPSYNIGLMGATVGDSQVATICCPSGYRYGGKGCISTATSVSARRLYTTSDGRCSWSTVSDFTGSIETSNTKRNGVSKETATFTAYPICLVNGGENTGLPTGAKIGIGVGVPLGVLLIAGVTFIWWYRRNKSRKAAAAAAREAPSLSEDASKKSSVVPVGVVKPELDNGDPMYQKAELDTGAVIVSGPSKGPVEMPNEQIPSAPAELQAVQSSNTPQAELPGDFEYTAAKNDGGQDANVASLSTSVPTIVVDPSSPLSPEQGTK